MYFEQDMQHSRKLLTLLHKCIEDDSYIKNIMINQILKNYKKYFYENDADFWESMCFEDKSVAELSELYVELRQLKELHKRTNTLIYYRIEHGDLKKLIELGYPNLRDVEKLQKYCETLTKHESSPNPQNYTNIPQHSPYLFFNSDTLFDTTLLKVNEYIKLTGDVGYDNYILGEFFREKGIYYCFPIKEFETFTFELKRYYEFRDILKIKLVPFTEDGKKILNAVEEFKAFIRKNSWNDSFQEFLQIKNIVSDFFNLYETKDYPIHLIDKNEIEEVWEKLYNKANSQLIVILFKVDFEEYVELLQGDIKDINTLLLLTINFGKILEDEKKVQCANYHNLLGKKIDEIFQIKKQISFSMPDAIPRSIKKLNADGIAYDHLDIIFKDRFYIINDGQYNRFKKLLEEAIEKEELAKNVKKTIAKAVMGTIFIVVVLFLLLYINNKTVKIWSWEVMKGFGKSDIQNEIGIAYEYGKGVSKNSEKAVYWYELAANKGDATAQNNLAMSYEEGNGVDKDIEKAEYWYELATEGGNIQAHNNLANLYFDGTGHVEQDYEKAWEFYNVAAKGNQPHALTSIGIYYYQGILEEKNYEKAFEYFQKAADLGNRDSMQMIAKMYSEGTGVKQDNEQASYWLRKSKQ